MWNSKCSTQTSFRDYLGALQCCRSENPTDLGMLSSTSFLVDYPFDKRPHPGALNAFERFSCWAQTVVRSDDDVVLQRRTVELPASSEVVESHVTNYLHQEEALEGVRKRYPARQGIQLDEKLGTVKKNWADSVTTMFPPQSNLAHDPAVFAAEPTPDVTVGRLSDLLGFKLPATAQHQSTMNRNPNLTRNEVTP
jgi:hypothetical protein